MLRRSRSHFGELVLLRQLDKAKVKAVSSPRLHVGESFEESDVACW